MTVRPRRNQIMRVRMSDDEAARWTAAAEAGGHASLSSWIRALADQAAATGSTGREVAGVLVSLRQDLARGIGNNINQMAKACNEGSRLNGERLADAALDIHHATLAIGRALRVIRPPRAKAA